MLYLFSGAFLFGAGVFFGWAIAYRGYDDADIKTMVEGLDDHKANIEALIEVVNNHKDNIERLAANQSWITGCLHDQFNDPNNKG